jgi:hypothetical protein
VTTSQNHPINCGEADSEFAFNFAKQTIADRSVDVTVTTEFKPLFGSSESSVVLGDTNYLRNTPSIAGTSARLNLEYRQDKFPRVRATSSSNLAVLAPAAGDPLLFEYQSTGSAVLGFELSNGERFAKSVTASITSSPTVDTFVSFVSGSLGQHIDQQTRARANGSTSSPEHYPIYSTYNQTTNTYAKNAGCWAADLDFSGMTVNRVGSVPAGRVSAITPHHAIGAAHYGPEVGDVIYFCDANNQTVSRTVSAREDFSDSDSCIVRFSQALPGTVKTYKTLPANWQDYAPIANSAGDRTFNWPILITSHYRWDAEWPLQRSNRFVYISEIYRNLGTVILFRRSSPDFADYDGSPSGIRGGDSGGPCFFIINGELVLVHCFFGANGGPFQPAYLAQIQAAIDTLGPGGQTYETVDLSGFTNFAS